MPITQLTCATQIAALSYGRDPSSDYSVDMRNFNLHKAMWPKRLVSSPVIPEALLCVHSVPQCAAKVRPRRHGCGVRPDGPRRPQQGQSADQRGRFRGGWPASRRSAPCSSQTMGQLARKWWGRVQRCDPNTRATLQPICTQTWRGATKKARNRSVPPLASLMQGPTK
jgi:hypothetical protein